MQPKDGKNVLNKQKIQTASIDPQTGSIWLTYLNNDGKSNMYAIKGGESMLDEIGDKALTNLYDFTTSLGSMKIPENIIKVGNNMGYYIQKDPTNLRPIVKQVRFNNEGKIDGISKEIDPNFVYNDLLTQLLRSQGIENEPKPTKF